ncbi:MAG: DNA-processing protein DprA [Xanthomonadales bacterium]|nr:DNA-processing protein DprA [Xanthomonadales bacterium]
MRAAGLRDEAVATFRNPDQRQLESDLEWLSQPGHDLLTWDDERYPPLLRNISSPPPAVFVDGDADQLWRPQLAVIGSRNPTAGGKENARDFASELVRQGMTITSGLASGIDSIAHAAALDAGGFTVAVTGTGLDRVYPASSYALAGRIRERGVLVSELPPGTGAKRAHFPSRNRIISGLSLGVLVIEAGLRSGTLITARLAGNQGREVFALPGSIHNPMSKGCHRLIRDGARLVENVADIMTELAPLAGQLAAELSSELLKPAERPEQSVNPEALDSAAVDPHVDDDPDYRRLWSCLGFDPRPVDAIIEQSGLTARAVSAMLLMLELRGKVEAHQGGAWSRKK